MKTLALYLLDHERKFTQQTGISQAINDIAKACCQIASLIERGPFAGIHGSAGNTNIQGEDQQQLDVLSNQIILDVLGSSGNWAGLASEEMENIYHIPPQVQKGKYLCLFDPIDGSGNIAIDMPIGTIFSVLAYNGGDKPPTNADFMQTGKSQVAAGYVLYGASTTMVLTLGNGVISLTLDNNLNEFCITKIDISIPEQSNSFAINMSNYHHWEPAMRQYIDECLLGQNGVRRKYYNMRWTGCMVADAHRVLCQGGLFIYPIDKKDNKKPAKLRLMYEANPIGFLVEQAGGRCITGYEEILNIKPDSLHQRVPVIIGSKAEIDYIEELHLRCGIN